MDNTKELTHISLCAGYGGIDLGLKRVFPNMRTVAFSEIEAYAVANLVTKMEAGLLDVAPIWTDLKTFPFGKFRGKVDILSGGFPCQPFSSAGLRRGDEDPRHLFPYIKQGIKKLRPTFIFLENVEGIINARLGNDEWNDPRGTPVLLHVLRELERLGYKSTAGIFTASEIGAPHQRKRVFIMAYSNQEESSEKRIDISSTSSPEYSSQSGGVWPSRRGEDQREWEPPRVMLKRLDYNLCNRLQITSRKNDKKKDRRQKTDESFRTVLYRRTMEESSSFKSPMDRDVNGDPDRMDYDKLCRSVCNKTDELRLLGNGVVPATAERAFRVLWERLAGKKNP